MAKPLAWAQGLWRAVRPCCASLGLLACTALVRPALAQAYYEQYDLRPQAEVVTLLVQPMAYPLASISSVMQRDRVLREDLQQQKLRLQVLRFRKGADIVKVAQPDAFGMAFVGDMPTVNLAMKFPLAIAGLGKRNFSTVVARDANRLDELKGRRIGYSPGSSSHLVLMRGLKSVNLGARDVELVVLEPGDMPEALETGAVAAFSGWEPMPSVSLARNARNRAIYKGMSTDWVVLPRAWAQAQPRAALALVASFVRAVNWMRRSRDHVQTAASWVLADGSAFTGDPPKLALDKAMDIVYKDLLNVPGAPSLPSLIDGVAPLSREFAFLQELGLLPLTSSDLDLRQAFAYDGLKTVQADPKRFRVFSFSYDP